MNKVNKKEFIDIYNEKIFPHLKAWEVQREKICKMYYIPDKIITKYFLIPIIIGLFCTTITLEFEPFSTNTNFLYFFASFTLIAIVLEIWYFFALSKIKNFKTKLKKYFLPIVLEVFYNIKWLDGKKIINPEHIQKSKLFEKELTYIIDDSFVGKYKNIIFSIEERFVGENMQAGFIILLFELEKHFQDNLLILPKKEFDFKKIIMYLSYTLLAICWLFALLLLLSRDAFGVFGGIMLLLFITPISLIETGILKKINYKTKNTVKLEDVDFEKKYEIISEKQVESRTIITPATMEKILKLKTLYGANTIKCSIFENKVMFLFEAKKDVFEIGELDKTLLDPENFKNLLSELSAIYDLIDEFILKN